MTGSVPRPMSMIEPETCSRLTHAGHLHFHLMNILPCIDGIRWALQIVLASPSHEETASSPESSTFRPTIICSLSFQHTAQATQSQGSSTRYRSHTAISMSPATLNIKKTHLPLHLLSYLLHSFLYKNNMTTASTTSQGPTEYYAIADITFVIGYSKLRLRPEITKALHAETSSTSTIRSTVKRKKVLVHACDLPSARGALL